MTYLASKPSALAIVKLNVWPCTNAAILSLKKANQVSTSSWFESWGHPFQLFEVHAGHRLEAGYASKVCIG